MKPSCLAAILYASQGVMRRLVPQRTLRLEQFILQVDNSTPSPQPDVEFLLIERLDNVVVGARRHPLYHIFLLRPRRQQQNVGVGLYPFVTHQFADFRPRVI